MKKARKKSPWPRGLRIHPQNDPIAAFDDTHPAKQFLIARAECQQDCASREIAWPGKESEAVTQTFQSKVDPLHNWSFAGIVYAFICVDEVLDEWFLHPQEVTENEQHLLENAARGRALLAECEAAAKAEENLRVLPMIEQTRRVFELCQASVRLRMQEDGLE